MNLPVLDQSKETAGDPWYADGLDFNCTTCGNCCTGGPGYVFLSDQEIELAAEHLKVNVAEFTKQYCRKVGGRISLKEIRRTNGLHDCVFLTEVPVEPTKRELDAGEAVPQSRRICGIYSVRPLQCRTWPFWPENIRSESAWKRAGKGCPGINRAGRHFSIQEVESIRDAAEWPENPPTSGAGERKQV